jgi:predicted ATPase/DNA-binding SARP family transcriptional activator
MSSKSPPTDAHVTYSLQYRRCRKPGCGKCSTGSSGHGPYWFAYWRENGRLLSRYLGKTMPADVAPASEAAPLEATKASTALRVSTLGGLAVWRGSEPIPSAGWNRRAVRGLFTCLLSAPGCRLHREQLRELLWPDEARAGRKLNDTVHLLRRLLDGPDDAAGKIHLVGDVLVLEPAGGRQSDPDWLDALTFERTARIALDGTDRDACRAALAHYGGAYLPEEPYADWVVARRERLRELYLETLRHLAGLCGQVSDLAEAERCLSLLLVEDPCHEDAAAELMGMLASAGRRTEALRVYQTLAAALDADLGLAPGSEIESLRGQVLALVAAPSAAEINTQSTLSVQVGNLPTSLTSFVGRSWEREEIRGLLAPNGPPTDSLTRLLTLTGSGGCGKTRLALEAAVSLAEEYPDGVWLVELAALPDPGLVPRAIANALGLQERLKGMVGVALTAELLTFLEPRRLLLLLDNCEHVLLGCAELAGELLRGCPGLRILATSREPLRIAGEVVWRVPPLATPPVATNLEPTGLLQYEAVRLFMERAHAVRRDFVLTQQNAPAVLRICRWLDGLPLALELAAARLGVLPVEAVAARLDDCFQLLTGGSRTALPRQRTLRATMDWSYGLLPEAERTLFRRLSIFASGWTLDAAEGVCQDEEAGIAPRLSTITGVSMVDLLAELTARSLVQTAEAGGLVRYRLLETVRLYAQEQLRESGEALVVARRHRRWFLRQLEQARGGLRTADRAEWLDRLEGEIDNLRLALTSSGQGFEDTEEILRVAEPLTQFCLLRGYQAESRRWLASALEYHGAPANRAAALNAAGTLANEQGDYAAATTLYAEGLALYAELNDLRGMARLSINLGSVSGFQGNLEEARIRYEAGLQLARKLEDDTLLGLALNNLGSVAIDLGDIARAADVLEESLALKRRTGAQDGMIVTLINLGEVARALGDLDRAAALGEEALALAGTLGARRHTAHAQYNLGLVAGARGRLDQAEAAFLESLRIEQEVGNMRQIAGILEGLAAVATERGDYRFAGRFFGAAESLREQLGAPIPPTDRSRHEHATALVRAQLGPKSATAEWTAGRSLPIETAIKEALNAVDQ